MRYVVVSEYVGRGKYIHYIVDDLINQIVGEGFFKKAEAEKICRQLNKEIKEKTNDCKL